MTTVYCSHATFMFLLAHGTQAFVPTTFVQSHPRTSFQALPHADLVLHNEVAFLEDVRVTLSSSTLLVSSAVETIQTIAIVLGSTVAFLLVVSLLTAKFLVPQAAQQLEEQTKDKYPDLWQEALSRLAPGETLEMRPDLIQEYGRKLQDRMTADFVAQQQAYQERKDSTTASSMTDAARSWVSSSEDETSNEKPKTEFVDVEFTKDENTKS